MLISVVTIQISITGITAALQSQVCQLIDGIRQCAQIQTNIKREVIMLQYGSGNPLPSNSPL